MYQYVNINIAKFLRARASRDVFMKLIKINIYSEGVLILQ